MREVTIYVLFCKPFSLPKNVVLRVKPCAHLQGFTLLPSCVFHLPQQTEELFPLEGHFPLRGRSILEGNINGLGLLSVYHSNSLAIQSQILISGQQISNILV